MEDYNMKIVPYDEAYPNVDKQFVHNIKNISSHIEADDDFLILAIGPPRTGKSNLWLYGLEIHLGDKASVDFIAQTKESFANALDKAKDMPLPRAVLFDEASINKRKATSSFTTDIIEMYQVIAGLNILHFWATPSIEMMEKNFIEERIKAVVLFTSKNPNIRPYYWFDVNTILAIKAKYDNLSLPLLRRIKKKYAVYRGYFRKYNGKLLSDYLDGKETRMRQVITNFREKHGSIAETDNGMVKVSGLCTNLGIHRSTFQTYLEDETFATEVEKVSVTNAIGIKQYNFEETKKLIEAHAAKILEGRSNKMKAIWEEKRKLMKNEANA